MSLRSCRVLLAALLFFHGSQVVGQATEEEVISTIVQLGGRCHKDGDGNVTGIGLQGRNLRLPRLLDEHVEQIDFSALPRLQWISIFDSRRNLTNRSTIHLRTIPSGLRGLTISGTQMDEKELLVLLRKHKPSLRTLHLLDMPVTDRTLSEIGAYENLTSVSLQGSTITDKGLRNLVNLRQLGLLDLSWTTISDAGLGHITGLTSLTVLLLEDTKVTDAGLLQLQVLINLDRLNVSSTNVTDNAKRALQQLLPDLEFRIGD